MPYRLAKGCLKHLIGYGLEKKIFGIGEVTSAFAAGLTIDPSCGNLIAELETYHYPDGKIDTDKPVKEFDHSCDALRYGLASESPVLEGRLVY